MKFATVSGIVLEEKMKESSAPLNHRCPLQTCAAPMTSCALMEPVLLTTWSATDDGIVNMVTMRAHSAKRSPSFLPDHPPVLRTSSRVKINLVSMSVTCAMENGIVVMEKMRASSAQPHQLPPRHPRADPKSSCARIAIVYQSAAFAMVCGIVDMARTKLASANLFNLSLRQLVVAMSLSVIPTALMAVCIVLTSVMFVMVRSIVEVAKMRVVGVPPICAGDTCVKIDQDVSNGIKSAIKMLTVPTEMMKKIALCCPLKIWITRAELPSMDALTRTSAFQSDRLAMGAEIAQMDLTRKFVQLT